MKKLNALVAASALAVTIGLSGCGSDDKKSEETGTTSQTSSTTPQTQSSSESTPAQSNSESPASETTSSDGAVGGVQNCKLERKGEQLQAQAVGISCEDATQIWGKFSQKDQAIASGDVNHNGETWKCGILTQGSTVTGGCTVGQKAISIGGI
ncbi:hypothetical protein FB459_3031 [Yimella lutea]|uniref:Secreted protein n=1 Tax=Yimella lutea TaxID=587872 RepID=A0A542EJG9_9MICO|nr:hypothetical protein [Yimella lutea]TQJ15475.1 hypothetical protein FB459_3031 [Yimella lutea]